MDFSEHEDQDEEMDRAVPQGYDPATAARLRMGGGDGSAGARKPRAPLTRYRECLKNHALSVGGHAVDGCGEFMAAGEEGTLDALKCAACNCHRNFHRKETEGDGRGVVGIYHHHLQQAQEHHDPQLSPYYRALPPPPPAGYLHLTPPPQHRPLALPAASEGGYSREEEDVSNPSSSGGGVGELRKRFRTKFTAEQKEKMLGFAERVGWRIQKQDHSAVEQFCVETGVKRRVLKVWMHNNKHTLGKKP